jgi:hypothetical protein
MNLNDDVVYRCRRLGPLHQRHPGRSRSLVRHHNRPHPEPPGVEFSPEADWATDTQQDDWPRTGLPDLNGTTSDKAIV